MKTDYGKVTKTKKIDKELTLKVIQNEINGRVFVEFSSADGKLVVQKSFQNTHMGKKELAAFEGKFKSIKEFKTYLGIN